MMTFVLNGAKTNWSLLSEHTHIADAGSEAGERTNIVTRFYFLPDFLMPLPPTGRQGNKEKCKCVRKPPLRPVIPLAKIVVAHFVCVYK